MSIYLIIVAITIVFGFLMPQEGKKRKNYIILMALIHTFVCAFRYNHLTGDLMKYHWTFLQLADADWFSQDVLQGGRNSGFFLLNKLIYHLFGGEFQWVLIIIAIVIEIAVALLIYRYSPAPWLSYLVWNCMGFYVFGFSSIKQALAMAFLMFAMIGILEKRPKLFISMMICAGLIHVPSLIFLPAYFLAHRQVSGKTILIYLIAGALLYVFKNQFVEFIRTFYYEDDEVFTYTGNLGGRFFLLLLFALCGVLLRGLDSQEFEALFHMMAVATILQMLAGFDNIFTRLTDYYFQFSVLYIPMLFYHGTETRRPAALTALFPFNRRSRQLLAALVCVFLIWFYYITSIGVDIAYATDDYTNFRFMWEVK